MQTTVPPERTPIQTDGRTPSDAKRWCLRYLLWSTDLECQTGVDVDDVLNDVWQVLCLFDSCACKSVPDRTAPGWSA